MAITTADKNIDIYKLDLTKITTPGSEPVDFDDFLALTQPIGSINQAISNTLYGINSTGVKGVLPENRDSKGYVFFTRPQLNLTVGNIVNIRRLYSLLNTDVNSVHRYVRCLLDPRLANYTSTSEKNSEIELDASQKDIIKYDNKTKSTLLNNKLAFIPVLTNTIMDMSGWPDLTANAFTSKAGVRKEQYIQIDSSIDIFESFDLDCTFRNIKDEPILLMMQTWLLYAACVFEGLMNPYPDMIAENEIDYNTRIYRLIMDESGRYVKKIAATGAGFPINVPTGKIFDYTSTNYMENNKELNIRFKCVGAMYNDDILIQEFNATSLIFNKDLKEVLSYDGKDGSTVNFEKIPFELRDTFNHRGYPIIDTTTYELEWWVDKREADYKNIVSKIAKK